MARNRMIGFPYTKYMNAIFARSTFRSCLTDAERRMRH
jgi:hypothetical protein